MVRSIAIDQDTSWSWEITKSSNYGDTEDLDFPDPAITNIQRYLASKEHGSVAGYKQFNPKNQSLQDLAKSNTNLTDLCAFAFNTWWYNLGPQNSFYNNSLFNICITYPNLTTEVSKTNHYNADFLTNLAMYDIVGEERVGAAINMSHKAAFFMNRTCFFVGCDTNKTSPTVCDMDSLLLPQTSNVTLDFYNYTGPSGIPQYLSNDGIIACQQAICSATRNLLTTNSDIGGTGVRPFPTFPFPHYSHTMTFLYIY